MMLPVLRLSVIALILLAAGTAFSENPPSRDGVKRQPVQQKATTSEKPPVEDHRGTERMPLVIKGIPTEKTPEQAKEDRIEREIKAANEQGLTTYTGWLAAFTFGLVAVGICQLGLFWWQLTMIRKSLIDTKKAAEAANKSANAAELTVATMKDTAQRQLRAYLFLDGAVPLLRDTANGVEFLLSIKNVGQTPAHNLNHWLSADMRLPSNHEFSSGIFTSMNMYLPPGALVEMSLTWETPWRLQILDTDVGDNVTLYVWGEIKFIDAFDHPQTMKFRFQRRRFPGAILEYCEEGNHAT